MELELELDDGDPRLLSLKEVKSEVSDSCILGEEESGDLVLRS